MDSISSSAVDAVNQRIATAYDRLPYDSYAFPETHPSRLAAVAKLFGFSPATPSRARILELGCASGGNLIPIAARFSDAQCLGVDLSRKQVEDGKKRLDFLGLKNITLECKSIDEIDEREGLFDYIIAHGVYSWIPGPIQDALLRVCKNNLAPNGVAYVSYNVLPGWRLRQTLRDAFELHVDPTSASQDQVTMAKQLLHFLAAFTKEETVWGRLIREEANSLLKFQDSYLAHEFLEECNAPITFVNFMRKVQSVGLNYLGDAQVGTMLPEHIGKEAAAALRANVGNNQIAIEQYIDIVTGRRFRQTLLIHKDATGQDVRRVDSSAIRQLHFVARKDFKFDRDKAGASYFKDKTGAWVSTNDPIVKKAVQIVVKRLPASTCFADVEEDLRKQGIELTPQHRANILDVFYTMITCNVAEISAEPVSTAPSISERPVACPLLRSDAAFGFLTSTSLRHAPIGIGEIEQVLLPLLDGTNNRNKLADEMKKALLAGKINLKPEEQQEITTNPAAHAASIVDRFLASMLENACLVG